MNAVATFSDTPSFLEPEPSVTPIVPETLPAAASEPARTRPRRKRAVVIDVPAWQEGWPEEAQVKCYYQRRELAAAQACIKKQKTLIAQLRHEVRLRDRVMRLKHEQKLEGITQQITRQLAAERALDDTTPQQEA